MQPTVCALCLTADRQALTDRAVRSFLAQDYENRRLLIWDTGKTAYDCFDLVLHDNRLTLVRDYPAAIGKMRNDALWWLTAAAKATPGINDIICHWDSDDWSAPTRISDQVKLLVESGKDAVGYREMLFWDSRGPGEAWLYTNVDSRYCVGTSLAYWRSTWESKPFPECHIGEERHWVKERKTLGIPLDAGSPKMIACIHGSNTVKNAINASANCHNPDGIPYWQRLPARDDELRRIVESA